MSGRNLTRYSDCVRFAQPEGKRIQGSEAAARTRVVAETAYAGVGKSGFGGMCGPLLELFSVLSLALLPGDSGSSEAAEIRKKKTNKTRTM